MKDTGVTGEGEEFAKRNADKEHKCRKKENLLKMRLQRRQSFAFNPLLCQLMSV